MKKNNLTIIIIAAVIIVLLIVAVFYFKNQANQKDQEMVEMVEQMNFEKEQIEQEFSDMSVEFDGYTSNIKNDSLVQQLQNEKSKVQQLLEELRVTKSTNARKISELKKELATVRAVMVKLVTQIDSLNTENKALKTENKEVQRKYNVVTQTVQQLSKEKQSLNEVVTRASQLEVVNFSMATLNSKGKKTTWFSQTANLQFNYTITKNITAPPGDKTMYLRITKPDGDVLTKSPANVFPFENKEIAFSCSKKFEYSGDEIKDVLYWKIGEILDKGTYRVDFFADGNRIGSFSFALDK